MLNSNHHFLLVMPLLQLSQLIRIRVHRKVCQDSSPCSRLLCHLHCLISRTVLVKFGFVCFLLFKSGLMDEESRFLRIVYHIGAGKGVTRVDDVPVSRAIQEAGI